MEKSHPPSHPGEHIYKAFMEPFGHSCRLLAQHLDVSPSTLNRVLTGKSGVSPEMALRLSKALGRTAESWLALQYQYDLYHAQLKLDLSDVTKLGRDSSDEYDLSDANNNTPELATELQTRVVSSAVTPGKVVYGPAARDGRLITATYPDGTTKIGKFKNGVFKPFSG